MHFQNLATRKWKISQEQTINSESKRTQKKNKEQKEQIKHIQKHNKAKNTIKHI